MQEPVFQAGGQEAETVNETQAGGDQTDPSLYLKGWVLLTSRPSQADNPVLHKKPEISISVRAQILSWCRGVLKGLHAEGQWQAVWTLPVRALVGSDLHSVEAWPRVAGRLQGQRVTIRWAGTTPRGCSQACGLSVGVTVGCCLRQEACLGTL